MSKVILGLGLFGHDATTCLVEESTGNILFAGAEERFNNLKHSSSFPTGGIQKCMDLIEEKGHELSEIAINVNEVEILTGTLQTAVQNATEDEKGSKDFIEFLISIYQFGDYYYYQDIGSFSKEQINQYLDNWGISDEQKQLIIKRIYWYYNLAVYYNKTITLVQTLYPKVPVTRVNHHLCHAASAYYGSGYDDATIITLDGQGESETATIYKATKGKMELIASTLWPSSIGIFYWDATRYLGYQTFDEYRVMGMAAYGEPKYFDLFKDIFKVEDNGVISCTENEYYTIQEVPGCNGHFYTDFTTALESIVPRPKSRDELEQIHFDFAASIQKITEELGVAYASKAMELTGIKNLAIAGGVGLNGLMNEQIRLRSGCGNNIFIFPAAGDDGGPVGAAQYLAHARNTIPAKRIYNAFWGTECTDEAIEKDLETLGLVYEKSADIHKDIAAALYDQKIVARCNGKAEFGPRALGNRSILANPCTKEMKDILNERIKHREPFRPFAPACMHEHIEEYFEIDTHTPFMLLIAKGREKAKNEIPAVYHDDGTARVQSVTMDYNPEFYKTIQAFYELSGVPVVINTSFNVNGEAIVDSPLDTIESFGHMDIDYLAIGNYWVSKEKNKDKFPALDDKTYLKIRKNRFFDNNTHPLKEYDIYRYYFNFMGPAGLNSLQRVKRIIKKAIQ